MHVIAYMLKVSSYGILTTKINMFKSSHCSIRKSVLKNFAKFTGKHLLQKEFSDTGKRLAQEFCNIFKNSFLAEHLRTAVVAC